MMDWGTASLIEILWTGMALCGLGHAAWGVIVAYLDLRTQRARAATQPARERARRGLVTRANQRREVVTTFTLLVLVGIGIRALLLPPNPGSTDVGTFVTGLALFGVGAALTWCSICDRRDRRRFDRM